MSDSSSITILLIDSHREDRQYWVQRLNISSQAYRVLETETGAAGLDICRTQHVDCVVTELTLPDMSGFEVLVHLVPRATHPDIAVLMLTHVTLPAMATFALNSGAQKYLIKSRISGDYLDRAIQRAIAFIGPRKNNF
ncbi:MAG TPA: response regulator [Nitrospira sp.]|nr:response regulator [Nitrospira sp.]